MSVRRAWTPSQDAALKVVVEQRCIKKWAVVASILQNQFNVLNKNGKQCRERYNNYLFSSLKRENWTVEEQSLLIQLQHQLGNRWVEISRSIAGRSQNCLKNHFYTILRRGLTKINRTIRYKLKRYRELQINPLYKLMRTSDLSNAKLQMLKTQIAWIGLIGQPNDISDAIKRTIDQLKSLTRELHRKPSAATPCTQMLPIFCPSECYFKPPEEDEDADHQFPSSSSLLNSQNDNTALLQNTVPESTFTLQQIFQRSSCQIREFATPDKEPGLSQTKQQPLGICGSPYFDQLRLGRWQSWYNLYPH